MVLSCSRISTVKTSLNPARPQVCVPRQVRAGWLSDPPGLPGLAHLTEHLLFFASDKYPKEDEYSKFLARPARLRERAACARSLYWPCSQLPNKQVAGGCWRVRCAALQARKPRPPWHQTDCPRGSARTVPGTLRALLAGACAAPL